MIHFSLYQHHWWIASNYGLFIFHSATNCIGASCIKYGLFFLIVISI